MGIRVHKRRVLLVAALVLALCGSALYTRFEARDGNMLTSWVRLLEIGGMIELTLTVTGVSEHAHVCAYATNSFEALITSNLGQKAHQHLNSTSASTTSKSSERTIPTTVKSLQPSDQSLRDMSRLQATFTTHTPHSPIN